MKPVARDQTREQAANERPDQTGHERQSPIDLAPARTEHDLCDPSCGEAQDDDGEDEQGSEGTRGPAETTS